MNIDQYLGVFIDESKENLQNLNEYLLKLESNYSDTSILHEIFRFIHTLKGMSGSMGYENISNLTHHMENVLDKMRNKELKANAEIVDLLFTCLDRLETFLESVIENNTDKGEINDLLSKLEIVSHCSKDDVYIDKKSLDNTLEGFNEYEMLVLNEAKLQGNNLLELIITLEKTCVLPAARAYMVDRALDPHGEVVKSIPDTEEIEDGKFDGLFKLFYITKSDEELIKSTIMDISEVESVEIIEIKDIDISNSIDIKQKEVNNEIEKNNDNVSVENTTTKISPEKQKSNEEPPKTAKNKSGSKLPQTIRVSAERLDILMNLVGELVINKTRVEQLAYDRNYSSLSSALNVVGSVTNDIQEIVMKLRMVPVENIFNRFPRLVRDISKDLGKKVNLKIDGQDTEMDRAVIEDLGDPLVHLIRNSVDHGLETPEERLKLGKSEEGTLQLSAYNEGDNIIIKVKDDGKGLNVDRIAKKAIEKGIVTSDTLKTMSDSEIKDLILLPGFSTHDVATDISGRGVGMDVVKTRIADLGGTLNIDSETNMGTTVTICLPSTVVILQALLVKVLDEVYAVPLNNINEVIDISIKDVFTVQKSEVILLRGKTMPLIRLNKLLGIPESEKNNENLTVVIAQAAERIAGIVVSDLIGQKEVVIKPINKKFCEANYFSGATTLGNGEVALIINVNGVI